MTYCLEGAVFIAGAVVQWLRDGLGIIRQSSEVDALAAQVPDTGGVYFVPAFVGLGAPDWDSHARGLIIGLTRGTTARASGSRGASSRWPIKRSTCSHAMQQDAGIELATLKVDGGASRSDLLMQFQADLLGVPVRRPKVTERRRWAPPFWPGSRWATGTAPTPWPRPGRWTANSRRPWTRPKGRAAAAAGARRWSGRRDGNSYQPGTTLRLAICIHFSPANRLASRPAGIW